MARRLPSFAVLGFRPHTYWTAAVAVTGPLDAPRVLERRKILFAAGDERSVYHNVEGMARTEAEAWIARVWNATVEHATRGIGQMARDLRGDGHTLSLAIVPIGRAKAPDKLEDILKSHARIHAAEGDFYRGVVARACEASGLAVRRVVERDLPAKVAGQLGLEQPALAARMKAIGAAIGPPWSEDEKLATLAAWLHLEAAGSVA